MKTISINGYVIVDVPEGAKDFVINGIALFYKVPNKIAGQMSEVKGLWLPATHTYTILGRERELSEEMAAEIVTMDEDNYPWYSNYEGMMPMSYNAKQSLASLTRSLKMDNPIFLKTTER